MSEALQQSNDPYAIPLADINVADPDLFMNDEHWGFFDRLRKKPQCTTARIAAVVPSGR